MPTIEENETIKPVPATGIVSSTVQPAGVTDSQVTDQVQAQAVDVAKPTTAEVTDKPVLSEVDAATETVEGRLGELTSGESKYVNLARSDAERSANTRGLVNSAMAAGLGQEAAIRSALPIAQQDASTYSDRAVMNQAEQNKFNINQQSANLNNEADALRSELAKSEQAWSTELQTKMELTLANEKISNDVKLQYVQNIAQLTTDATTQITDIGLSDRTAEAQAAAISRIEQNRDASIAVYEDLLGSMDDWEWGTDFTPEKSTVAEDNNYWNAPGGAQPLTEPEIGTVIDAKRYEGNGIWSSIFGD